jgi:two-component system CheB/CheR fusion protein
MAAPENAPSAPDSTSPDDSATPMPIVGIGASAGGIDALRQFFDAVPPNNDMAFVVVLHLAPDRESNLIGAALTITPGEDGGTTVRCTLPLAALQVD